MFIAAKCVTLTHTTDSYTHLIHHISLPLNKTNCFTEISGTPVEDCGGVTLTNFRLKRTDDQSQGRHLRLLTNVHVYQLINLLNQYKHSVLWLSSVPNQISILSMLNKHDLKYSLKLFLHFITTSLAVNIFQMFEPKQIKELLNASALVVGLQLHRNFIFRFIYVYIAQCIAIFHVNNSHNSVNKWISQWKYLQWHKQRKVLLTSSHK